MQREVEQSVDSGSVTGSASAQRAKMAFKSEWMDTILAKDRQHDAISARKKWSLEQAHDLARRKYSRDLQDAVLDAIDIAYSADKGLATVERVGENWLPDLGFGLIEDDPDDYPKNTSQNGLAKAKAIELQTQLRHLLRFSSDHKPGHEGATQTQSYFQQYVASSVNVKKSQRDGAFQRLLDQLNRHSIPSAKQQVNRLKMLNANDELMDSAELMEHSLSTLRASPRDPNDEITKSSLKSAIGTTDRYVSILRHHISQLDSAHIRKSDGLEGDLASKLVSLHIEPPVDRESSSARELESWKKVPSYIDAKKFLLSCPGSHTWHHKTREALINGLKHVCQRKADFDELFKILKDKRRRVTRAKLPQRIFDFIAGKSLMEAVNALKNMHGPNVQTLGPRKADLEIHCLEGLLYANSPPEGSRHYERRLSQLREDLKSVRSRTWRAWTSQAFKVCETQHTLMLRHIVTIDQYTDMHDLAVPAQMFANTLISCKAQLRPNSSLDRRLVSSASGAIATAIEHVSAYNKCLKRRIDKQRLAIQSYKVAYEEYSGMAMDEVSRLLGDEQHQRWKMAVRGHTTQKTAQLGAKVAQSFLHDGTEHNNVDQQYHKTRALIKEQQDDPNKETSGYIMRYLTLHDKELASKLANRHKTPIKEEEIGPEWLRIARGVMSPTQSVSRPADGEPKETLDESVR